MKDYLEEPCQLERQVRVEGWFPEGKQWTDSVPEVCAIVSTNLSLSGGGPMVLHHTKYKQKNLKNPSLHSKSQLSNFYKECGIYLGRLALVCQLS